MHNFGLSDISRHKPTPDGHGQFLDLYTALEKMLWFLEAIKFYEWSPMRLGIKWLIGKNEVLFVVHEFQNFDSLQTCIKSADWKNNELHN